MEANFYEVRVKLLTPLLGTKPDKDTFAEYLTKDAKEEGISDDLLKDEADTLPTAGEIGAVEERGTTRFNKEKGVGLFIYDYTVKGFFKNAGNILKDQLGIGALKSKIQDFVFVGPRKIFLENEDGSIKQEADNIFARPKLVDGKFGKQSVVGVSEEVKNVYLTFKVMLLDNKAKKKSEAISEETIKKILDYGFLHGLGQWRNGSYGTFKVLSFNEVTEMTPEGWIEFCHPNGVSMDENLEE